MRVEVARNERREWSVRIWRQHAPAKADAPEHEAPPPLNLVDIHSHVVWGVDDGPSSNEASLAMLRSASEHGTALIVATPHSNSEYSYHQELIDARVLQLSAITDGKPQLFRGCDFHLNFENLDSLLLQPPRYTINGKQYLLVECPPTYVGSHTESVLQRLLDARIVPIVTHPERNVVLQRKLSRVEAWVDHGCLVQVTALSITGSFGRPAQRAAERLLARGLVHVAASDAHDPEHRHPRLDQAYNAVRSRYGPSTAQLLFRDNPLSIVEGRPLTGGRQLPEDRPALWWLV